VFFNQTLSNPYLDAFFVSLTTKGYLLFVPIIVGLFFFVEDRRRYLAGLLILFLSLSLNDWISTECKSLFERIRPCHFKDYRDVIGCSNSFSMPSNHASNAFAVATVLIYFFKDLKSSPLLSICTITIAIFIGISRIYLGVHYPSDVLVGALFGISISLSTISLSNKLKTYYKQSPIETIMLFLMVAFSLFRIYYIRHGGIDLSPDEAHYWEWSRRPDWSYYSKGPLVAWIIGLSTSVFGNSVLAIRIIAVIMLSISSMIIFSLTRQIAFRSLLNENDSKKAGLLAFLCIQTIPLFSVYGLVFTIDSPLIFFWSLSLYFFYKAMNDKGNYRTWFFLGLLIGLGLLAKYTMAFFIACFVVYIFIIDRKLFLKPYPYLTLFVTLLVFSPVIYWNMSNDWVTLKHTAGQANIASGLSLSVKYFFEFIGSQVGVVTPLLFIMLITSIFTTKKIMYKKDWLFVLTFSLPVLIFFLFKSLQGKVQANWAMPGYISLVILFSIVWFKGFVFFQEKISKETKLLTTAFLIVLLINIIGLYPHFFHIPTKLDPSARLRGWSSLANEVDKLRDSLQKLGEPVIIFSDSYQVASEMAFYLKGNPVTYCINFTNRRMNQYDLWEEPNHAIKRILFNHGKINGLFVGSTVLDYSGELSHYCERSEKHFINVVHKGRQMGLHFVFICYNLTSLPHERARHF
ncbi:MAG: glycosyltransferase family 39 protein, partial [Thermodesulfovibrionales bacterium]|nr:glycosyltransferase family 39 protein [Thermodesulfovibrionales bacterium]